MGSRGNLDISHDLKTLARSRVITVCAGAKAILDLPKLWSIWRQKGYVLLGRTKTLPAF